MSELDRRGDVPHFGSPTPHSALRVVSGNRRPTVAIGVGAIPAAIGTIIRGLRAEAKLFECAETLSRVLDDGTVVPVGVGVRLRSNRRLAGARCSHGKPMRLPL